MPAHPNKLPAPRHKRAPWKQDPGLPAWPLRALGRLGIVAFASRDALRRSATRLACYSLLHDGYCLSRGTIPTFQMAAPIMELRAVPAGANAYHHRGSENLVRLLDGSSLMATLTDAPFKADPTDATTTTLPMHFLEGLYSRVAVPDATVAPADLRIGTHCISVAWLCKTELALKANNVSFESCDTAIFIRRLAAAAASAGSGDYAITAADFTATEPFRGDEGDDDTWPSDVSIASLADISGRLSVFGDLCLLLGPRSTRDVRRLSIEPMSLFASTMVALGSAVCAADDGLTRPQATPGVPAVPAVAGVPAQYAPVAGRGRGRGRGALIAPAQPFVPAVPAVPARPFPSTDIDEDVRLGIADWLRNYSMPIELTAVPSNRREVRLELQARAHFADEGKREGVIRQRFTQLLTCLPHVAKVVAGANLMAQLETVKRMALSMLDTTFDVKQVAAFRALDDVVGKYIYVLGEDGGHGLEVSARAAKVIEAHTDAAQRRRAAPAASGDGAAGAASSAASGASVGSYVGGSGKSTPAFSKTAIGSLNEFIRDNETAFVDALRKPDATGVCALDGGGDSKRILAQALKPRWGVAYLQFVPSEISAPNAPMFELVAPHRHMRYEYLSNKVFANVDGSLDDDLEGDLLNHAFVDKFLDGDSWENINWYDNLVGVAKRTRGTVDRIPIDERWPEGVFSCEKALSNLVVPLDQLFSAIGYRARSRTGVMNALERLVEYLNKHDHVDDQPGPVLFNIFQEFMRNANGFYISAKRSMANAQFPVFRTDSPSWIKRLDDLKRSAQDEAQTRKRKGMIANASAWASAPPAKMAAAYHTFADRSPGSAFASSPFAGAIAAGNVDGSRKRDRSPSTSSFGSVPDQLQLSPPAASPGAPKQTASPWGGTKAVGEWKARVLVNNASLLRISFPSRKGEDMSWDFKAGKCRKWLRDNEGTDAKCLPCAVCRHPNRHAFCPESCAAGHESATSAAHTFITKPWEEFQKPEYSSRTR